MNMCYPPHSENILDTVIRQRTRNQKEKRKTEKDEITKTRKQKTSMSELAMEWRAGWGEEEEQVQTPAIFSSVIDRLERKKSMVRKKKKKRSQAFSQ